MSSELNLYINLTLIWNFKFICMPCSAVLMCQLLYRCVYIKREKKNTSCKRVRHMDNFGQNLLGFLSLLPACLSYGSGHNVNISSNQFELLSVAVVVAFVCKCNCDYVRVVKAGTQGERERLSLYQCCWVQNIWAFLSASLGHEEGHSKDRLLFVFNVTLLLMFALIVAAAVAVLYSGESCVALVA